MFIVQGWCKRNDLKIKRGLPIKNETLGRHETP